jgi:CheY-like chemotaxis protein/anti-sigma regulatory factor (Ser/Thr protein kinase)
MNQGDRDLRLENARLQRDLADSRRQLEEVRGEFDRFAGRLSHDLQAVMQINEGFATALSRTAAPKLDDRERHYLERIAATSVRGNRLVHEVLAFARLGVHPIARRPVALSDALARAQRAVQDQADGRHVDWVVGELPTVWGDASLLQQVLVDLLANALHSSRERARAVIRIECVAADPGWEIRVTDNGAGFDPKAADRLFESFERQHGTSGEATGLAQARRIVERHGGRIRVESAPGGGALCAFTLPASDALEPAVVPDTPQQPVDTPKPAALRVLLVDDDPMVLLALTNMVQLDGHHVDSAAGGQAGIEAFRRALAQGRGYDAVITDLGMPHMDGREVARLVKQASPATRVILLTGWGSGAGDGDGQVDGILAKPPRLAQLRQALSRVRPA